MLHKGASRNTIDINLGYYSDQYVGLPYDDI